MFWQDKSYCKPRQNHKLTYTHCYSILLLSHQFLNPQETLIILEYGWDLTVAVVIIIILGISIMTTFIFVYTTNIDVYLFLNYNNKWKCWCFFSLCLVSFFYDVLFFTDLNVTKIGFSSICLTRVLFSVRFLFEIFLLRWRSGLLVGCSII